MGPSQVGMLQGRAGHGLRSGNCCSRLDRQQRAMRAWGKRVAGPLDTLAEGLVPCLSDVSMVLGICWSLQHRSDLLPLPWAWIPPGLGAARGRVLFLKDTGSRATRHSGCVSWLWSDAQEPYLAEFPIASPCQAVAGKRLPAETMPVDPPEPVLLQRLL